MTDEWHLMPGFDGVWRLARDGEWTATTSLVDWSASREVILDQIDPSGAHAWVPEAVLGRVIEEVVGDVRPPVIDADVLPADRIASPVGWSPASPLRFSQSSDAVLPSQLFPGVRPDEGLLLTEGEDLLLDQPARAVTAHWAEPGAAASLLGTRPMKQIQGTPSLTLTSRRLSVWAKIEHSADADDRTLLATVAPSIDRVIHLSRQSRQAFGSTGLYWGSQVQLDWVRSIVVRHTQTTKSKGLVGRLLGGSAGESKSVGVLVEMPTGRTCELFFFTGRDDGIAAADDLVSALSGAIGPSASNLGRR